jgi:hypothetical protein
MGLWKFSGVVSWPRSHPFGPLRAGSSQAARKDGPPARGGTARSKSETKLARQRGTGRLSGHGNRGLARQHDHWFLAAGQQKRHTRSHTKELMTGAQLTTDVERLRVEAANRPRDEKEQLGQFLTPPDVAELVASLFQPLPIAARVRLLDPGAGIAEQETN